MTLLHERKTGCFGAVITFIIRRPSSRWVSLSELRPARPVDNLPVAAPSFRRVGEEAAVLGEEALPVAGNVFHPQVVRDEVLTPARRETNRVSG